MEANTDAIRDSLIRWNKNLLEVHKILDNMNKEFQEIYKDVCMER